MEAVHKSFLTAVSCERQKSWDKAVVRYEEVLSTIYKLKWNNSLNKEKLRLLLFECHFHCAVALQNRQKYQRALRHFQRAMEVVSWRKDECQAGCITGRVLHLHVPTLARIACCLIHQGNLKEALANADKAILLDFRNPDLFCVRSLVNFLLKRQEKALLDASFAVKLNPSQVCGWLLRGLYKKTERKEGNRSKQERDLDKACEVNPDAVMFVDTDNLQAHFQSIFDRFLPSTRVSHSISVHDILDADRTARQASRVSPPTFMCGTAKPKRRMRTCPSQEKSYSERHLERFHTEQSISHHRSSLNIISRHPERHVSRAYSSLDTCTSRVPLLTLRDVVETKSACLCRGQRFIGTGLHRERQGNLEFIEDLTYLSERMYARKWFQDRIPTKIPDFTGCRKLL
ncbi:uncharacterized protein [Porites lutea]|uniref:uncharacterized protein n=1 Tax=Porites lutea TaxID=51062 RepID=UPI003CC60EF9